MDNPIEANIIIWLLIVATALMIYSIAKSDNKLKKQRKSGLKETRNQSELIGRRTKKIKP